MSGRATCKWFERGRVAQQFEIWLVLETMCVLMILLGCGHAPSPQSPALILHTPETRFDWAIERLGQALEMSKPTGVEALHVRRDMSHQLYPPDESNPSYRARITIESVSMYYATNGGKRKEKASKKKRESSKPKKDLLIDDPFAHDQERLLADAPIEYLDLPGIGPKAPLSVKAKVETPRVATKTSYEWIYREEKWELVEPPESNQERMWFEYALQTKL